MSEFFKDFEKTRPSAQSPLPGSSVSSVVRTKSRPVEREDDDAERSSLFSGSGVVQMFGVDVPTPLFWIGALGMTATVGKKVYNYVQDSKTAVPLNLTQAVPQPATSPEQKAVAEPEQKQQQQPFNRTDALRIRAQAQAPLNVDLPPVNESELKQVREPDAHENDPKVQELHMRFRQHQYDLEKHYIGYIREYQKALIAKQKEIVHLQEELRVEQSKKAIKSKEPSIALPENVEPEEAEIEEVEEKPDIEEKEPENEIDLEAEENDEAEEEQMDEGDEEEQEYDAESNYLHD